MKEKDFDVEAFADDYETGGLLDETPDLHALDFNRGTYVDWDEVDRSGVFEE